MGIYVFDADYLYELLEEDDRDENSSHDFGKDLIPKITEAGLAYAHPFPLSAHNLTRMPSRTGAMWVRWKLTGKRISIWPLWCRNWICTIAIGQFAPTMNHYRQRNSCRIAPVATG
ncbi:sugar phosphate nucleotidyltransferase [Escherichia coli]